MRRWLLIFVLALLPLQFSWAAVARYCGHEIGHDAAAASSTHLGHHSHDHEAASGDPTPNAAEVDDDCASCHLGCAQPIPMDHSSAMPALDAPRVARPHVMPASYVPPGLERPDRSLA
jgi:hypothetical protein